MVDRGKKGTEFFFSGCCCCAGCVWWCVLLLWCGGKQILRASFVFSLLLVVRFGSQTNFFFDWWVMLLSGGWVVTHLTTNYQRRPSKEESPSCVVVCGVWRSSTTKTKGATRQGIHTNIQQTSRRLDTTQLCTVNTRMTMQRVLWRSTALQQQTAIPYKPACVRHDSKLHFLHRANDSVHNSPTVVGGRKQKQKILCIPAVNHKKPTAVATLL